MQRAVLVGLPLDHVEIGPWRALHDDRRELNLVSRGIRRRIDANAAEGQMNMPVVGEIERDDGGELVHRVVTVFKLPLLEELGDNHFNSGDGPVRRPHKI